MLITKFNRMIRNKVIWAVIAVVVSLAFVFSFSDVGGCAPLPSNASGTLYGEDVSFQELRTAIYYEMGLGNNRSLTAEESRQIEKQAWRRLAMLKTADRMGIQTTAEEVGTVIRREPGFNVNGLFDRDRYRQFVQSRGLTIEAFEEYVGQTLTIQKLISAMESMIWTAPSELTERLRNLTDERVISVATVSSQAIMDDVAVDEDACRAFFEADPTAFTIPERVRVRYVTFRIDDYIPEVVGEEAIQAYYDANIDDYQVASTNMFDLPIALDEVRDEITAILSRRLATFDAKDAATTFVVDLAPDRYGKQIDFETLAATHQRDIQETDFFAIDEPLTSLEVSLGFNRAAFDLIPDDPQSYFSDSIVGSNAVYVMAALNREPARVPSYDEVTDRVRPAALAAARQERFSEYLDRIQQDVREAIAASNTFAAVMQNFGHSTTSAGPFSIVGGPTTNELPFADQITMRLVTLYEGEIADPIRIDEDAVLLVHVDSRVPGDASSLYALRPELLGTLIDYRSGQLFTEWSDYVLQLADFTDLRQATPEDDGDFDADATDSY